MYILKDVGLHKKNSDATNYGNALWPSKNNVGEFICKNNRIVGKVLF